MDKSCIWNFKINKERKLPKSWEEFCEMFQIKDGECYFDDISVVYFATEGFDRKKNSDKNVLPDRATAEAILALCQLIQLRDCFNGDWKPIWLGMLKECEKYTIELNGGKIDANSTWTLSSSPLYFKTEELRDEFLRNFRPLIEKLKPLYGIKKGGQE